MTAGGGDEPPGSPRGDAARESPGGDAADAGPRLGVGVLASGSGTNLQAILDRLHS